MCLQLTNKILCFEEDLIMLRLAFDEVICPSAVLIALFCVLLVDDKGGTALYAGMLCAMVTPLGLGALCIVRRVFAGGPK